MNDGVMKFKVLFLFAVLVSQGTLRSESAYNFSVQVLDEDGRSISGAKVGHGFLSKIVPFEKQWTEAVTDSTGLVPLSGTAHDLGRIVVTKPGFYVSRDRPSAYLKRGWDGKQHTDWSPRGTVIKIVLRPRGDSVPMYAKKDRRRIPGGAVGTGFGYDLEKGDFVFPNGKGNIPDVIFYPTAWGDDEDDFRWSLTLEFPHKGDGIVELDSVIGYDGPRMRGSELRSPTLAPESGYQKRIVFYYNGVNERQGSKDKIYVFRVRTVFDEQSGVKSALYGKSYKSPWVGRVVKKMADDPLQRDWLHFHYYLNPDGSRNLQFDPKRNLFGELPTGNAVFVP
jgi:hypothetical protein